MGEWRARRWGRLLGRMACRPPTHTRPRQAPGAYVPPWIYRLRSSLPSAPGTDLLLSVVCLSPDREPRGRNGTHKVFENTAIRRAAGLPLPRRLRVALCVARSGTNVAGG